MKSISLVPTVAQSRSLSAMPSPLTRMPLPTAMPTVLQTAPNVVNVMDRVLGLGQDVMQLLQAREQRLAMEASYRRDMRLSDNEVKKAQYETSTRIAECQVQLAEIKKQNKESKRRHQYDMAKLDKMSVQIDKAIADYAATQDERYLLLALELLRNI